MMPITAVVPMLLKEVATTVRKDYGTLAFINLDRVDQSLVSEVSKVVIRPTQRFVASVAEVALRHDPKRPDGRQRAAFVAIDFIATVAIEDRLSFVTARQVDVVQEQIALVGRTVITVAIEAPVAIDFMVAIPVQISPIVDARGARRARIAGIVVIVAVPRILTRLRLVRVVVNAGIVTVEHCSPIPVSFAASVPSDR